MVNDKSSWKLRMASCFVYVITFFSSSQSRSSWACFGASWLCLIWRCCLLCAVYCVNRRKMGKQLSVKLHLIHFSFLIQNALFHQPINNNQLTYYDQTIDACLFNRTECTDCVVLPSSSCSLQGDCAGTLPSCL